MFGLFKGLVSKKMTLNLCLKNFANQFNSAFHKVLLLSTENIENKLFSKYFFDALFISKIFI